MAVGLFASHRACVAHGKKHGDYFTEQAERAEKES
jgi:hypothetical protein